MAKNGRKWLKVVDNGWKRLKMEKKKIVKINQKWLKTLENGQKQSKLVVTVENSKKKLDGVGPVDNRSSSD